MHMFPKPVLIISPRDLYQHEGVLFPFANGTQLVLTATQEAGVTWQSIDEFSGGRRWHVRNLAPKVSAVESLRRAEALTGKPYDLLTANCEHAARWVMGHPRESRQVRDYVLLALAAAILARIAA